MDNLHSESRLADESSVANFDDRARLVRLWQLCWSSPEVQAAIAQLEAPILESGVLLGGVAPTTDLAIPVIARLLC